MASVAKVTAMLVVLALAVPATAGPLDEMSLDRWAKLKENERYQLNVAEKFYRDKKYKVAGDEYEKFVKLYEKSEGAPFALLKWSHCQVDLRKHNTAITDGYQCVLDYFPESPEAPIAALLIGRTYRGMGDLKLAKKAYGKVLTSYPKHFASVMARSDLIDIAAKEGDTQTQTALLNYLTYEVERKGPTAEPCAEAARSLSHLLFRAGNFEEALKALATTCKEEGLATTLMNPKAGALGEIVHSLTGSKDEATKKLGEKLADAAATWLKKQASDGLADEKTKARAVAAWYSVAEVRRQARQPDKQRAVYEEMLAALPSDDQLLGRLAQWYKDNKQSEQARATYARFKDTVEGQSQIALSFLEEKQFDRAVDVYRKLALADTKSPARWLNAAASAYRQGGKPDQAIDIYRELLTSDSGQASNYHYQIAETLYEARRWSDSITAFRGTDRFPQNYQHMAGANIQLKKYDEAIGLYRQIMAASEQHSSWALFHIAKAHEMAGQKEDAIKMFKQVCDKFPKSQEGSQAHSHLNEKYKITVTLGGAKD